MKNKRRVVPWRKGKTCETRYCRGMKAKKPNGYLLSHCWKCRSRFLKQRRLVTYVLNILRGSAKRRGLPFELTIDQFAAWCAETGYLEKRGRKPESATVDRIDRTRGYSLDNIRILSFAENSKQGADNTRRQEPEEEPF